MQDLIVFEVVGQAERDPGARGRKYCCSTRHAEGRVREDPSNKLLFALPESRALALEQRPAGSPRQHEHGDGAGEHQGKPATFEQLGGVGRDKDQLDRE